MTQGRLHIDPPIPAGEALARGRALSAAIDSSRPVLLYGAPIDGAAIALGAFQHAPHALRAEAFEAIALPLLRRASGGAAVWAGAGVLYFALGLRDASVLMACPPGRLLNRNVRGVLAGLRGLGVPTHYFGRDFLSFGAEPGAYVGWDEGDDGRALLEFFVALDTAFTPAPELLGYPDPSEPALRGKTPSTLRKAGASRQSGDEVLRAIAAGYVKAFALELEAEAPSASELEHAAMLKTEIGVELEQDLGLAWSRPHEEAIGFISAGVALDAEGRVAALKLGGDLFQRRECPGRLEAELKGKRPDPASVGAALDAVYASRPGLIEGVRSLDTLRAAILNAVAKAEHAW